jgi:hypothetical protein
VARFVLILLAACRCVAQEAEPTTVTATSSPVGASPASTMSAVVTGACEASAVVRSGDRLLVGDNETKAHLFAFDAGHTLKDRPPVGAEVDDIEALVSTSAGTWVIGSQGRKKSGELDPERQRIAWMPNGGVGVPDLSACVPCRDAAARPPEMGGINVEGAFLHDDHLWLGLRSPVVDGKALLVELDVPAGGPVPAAPGVLRTRPIDLGGFSVRDVAPAAGGGFFVVAGPSDGAEVPHRLYRMTTPDEPPVLIAAPLPPSAEGIVDNGDGTLTFVTDGDGKKEQCKTPSTWGLLRLP